MKTFNLEERLIKFSVKVIELVDGVKKSRTGNHLSGQLIRSGTSCALNYGEAQGSESTKDFIHKLKIPVDFFIFYFKFIFYTNTSHY
mgnify:CR=1 FL=1